LRDAVPVDRVRLERQKGREIEAAAEPPGVASAQVTHVQVRRRHVGIERVHDERDAERAKFEAREFG